jgi:SH3 domain protein
MIPRLVLLLVLALGAAGVQAQTRYVSDRLEVTLRTGTSTQHAIVRMLPSGARVDVLQVDAASGYTRVRTADGVEGWVLTRYLMEQPAAREQLATAGGRVENLNARVQELSAEVEVLRGERDSLAAERDGLEAELTDLREELERIRRASASALELDKSNRELRTLLSAAEQGSDALRVEIAELKRNTRRDWFLAGAGVLGLGILLGIVLPRLRLRRRSRWGEL